MKKLKTPELKVQCQNNIFYGGNQAWFPYQFLQKTGCGVISAANVLLHMQKKEIISETEYMDFAKKLWRGYLPVIPGFGMNGLTLMIGLNRYFYHHHMPYTACWKISAGRMLSRIDQMLSKDLPVILAVGPNFPRFWGKHTLTFYVKTKEETFVPAVKVRAHFVTVTGREGVWLKISSWGKEYYIDIREYREYVKRDSCPLVSNIICIRKRKTIQ